MSSPETAADQPPSPVTPVAVEVAGVLAAHELGYRRGSVCLCGFVPDVQPETLQTQQDYHRAHVAAEVANALAAALGRPEVVEAAAQAVADIAGLVNHRAVTTAVLAAIPEALGAGEVDRG